jgi:HD superfamily phosphohydrolase
MTHEHKTHSLEALSVLGGNIGYDLNQLRYRPHYELSPDSFLIRDPVWGDEYIGDETYDKVLIELAHTDVLRRLQTVEQLTLPERYATIPDTYNFSRWEHMWGSLVAVRRWNKKMDLDSKESMYLQLKILLSDIKHTSFSHAGDWLFEGEGSNENAHEQRVDYTEVTGLNKLLQLHGFDPKIIFDDETTDITDSPSPGLDGDRVDYTLRESYRWVDQLPVFKEFLNPESISVIDGQVVMNDLVSARLIAGSHAMLVRHHWQHPIHRLQLNLMLESLRRIFVASNGKKTVWSSFSPRDLMNTSDITLLDKFRESDPFMHHIDGVMAALSQSEREVHWRHRQNVARFMIEMAVGIKPQKVEWLTEYYKTLPASCEISDLTNGEPHLRNSNRMIVIPLPVLRPRVIDPPYRLADGSVTTLSKGDPRFWSYLQTKLAVTRSTHQAGLVHNKETTSQLRNCLEQNKKKWPDVMSRPRMPSSGVRALLRETVKLSASEANNFIDMTLVGH